MVDVAASVRMAAMERVRAFIGLILDGVAVHEDNRPD